MSKVDRNNPQRSSASESRYTLFEFDRDFPDDAACLDTLVRMLYPNGIHCPKCEKVTKHFRDAGRPSYSCEYCGHHEHPMVGTIFEGSATSLRLWFYAMYLMASTRCGISAKQLERELGVTYKCAWRMFKQIRSLFDQEETLIEDGEVEIDEAYVGGKAKWRSRGLATGVKGGYDDKVQVLGYAKCGQSGDHGHIYARVMPKGVKRGVLTDVTARVLDKAMVYTDEAPAYETLGKKGYQHRRVHHRAHVYVDGPIHTNTIEGFWSLMKRGISGVYHSVSAKYLQAYVDEYTFRYNNRDADGLGVFSAMMDRVEKAPVR
jgi:transposase